MARRNLALHASPAPAKGARERRGDALRSYLRHVREVLDLSFDQVGRALRVNGETVRRWENAAIAIPEAQWAPVTMMDQEVHRMERLFTPERLPMVVRRPADMFEGRAAMDWLLEGRWQEVADLYESALLYQA